MQGEHILYDILNSIDDNKNIEDVIVALERSGYSLEYDQPEFDVTFDESVIKTVIDVNKMKLRVKRIVFEV